MAAAAASGGALAKLDEPALAGAALAAGALASCERAQPTSPRIALETLTRWLNFMINLKPKRGTPKLSCFRRAASENGSARLLGAPRGSKRVAQGVATMYASQPGWFCARTEGW